ncbi:MAG TPA: AMP-binding protein [Polyangiales bacterium]|nr:AMP-binding protein [Polyangiales bacterium]
MSQHQDDPAYREAVATGMYVGYWAARSPHAPALIGEQGRLSFAELNARSNRLARLLRERGLRPGDTLALLCHNCFEFAEAVAATRRIGVRLTPINFHLGADEVAYILRDCDAKVFMAAGRFADVAARAAQGIAEIHTRIAVDGDIPGFERLRALVEAYGTDDIPNPVLGVSMLYTSGSTGKPKGVARPSAPPTGAATSAIYRGNYTPGSDLHLCTGPLYHAAPLAYSLVIPLLSGAGVVLMDGWEAERSLQLIETHRITHTHMVPTMFHRLLGLSPEQRRSYALSSLRYVLHGAAPCPIEVKRALIEWLGPVVFEYYGATEGTGTMVDSETWLRKPGTVGQPEPRDQIKIMDDGGNELPAGDVGTVYLKSPAALRFNYHKDPGKTASAFRGDYYTVGDLGYLDEDGYLFLTDRSANLIISGGVNIYPAECDAVLLTHPAVHDVAVIGVPNAEWGEEVKAVVELEPGREASAALERELIEYCRARLAHYKCPRSVDFVTSLPRYDSGKLSKHALRERYRQAMRA